MRQRLIKKELPQIRDNIGIFEGLFVKTERLFLFDLVRVGEILDNELGDRTVIQLHLGTDQFGSASLEEKFELGDVHRILSLDFR